MKLRCNYPTLLLSFYNNFPPIFWQFFRKYFNNFPTISQTFFQYHPKTINRMEQEIFLVFVFQFSSDCVNRLAREVRFWVVINIFLNFIYVQFFVPMHGLATVTISKFERKFFIFIYCLDSQNRNVNRRC